MLKIWDKLGEFLKDNIAEICVIAVFAVFTIYNIINHIPWYDEVNAYNISQNLSVWEIFKLSRYEGHPVLWFLFLKPFTILNAFFPYNLLIPNFLLSLASLVMLWKYSPFNKLEKTLITLSAPMFFYAYVARCYSLSILFLFAICSLYNKRHKYPYWYSILLVLLANTSVIALYGAFVLGLLFLHDLYKFRKQNILTRKNIVIIMSFFIISGIFILAQLVNPHPMTPVWCKYADLWSEFWKDVFNNTNIFDKTVRYLFIFLIFVIPFMTQKNSIKPLIFLYGTVFLMVYSFTQIYPGSIWHTNFFYLYLIVAFWLFRYKKISFNIKQKIILFIWALFLFVNVVTPNWVYNGNYYSLKTELKEKCILKQYIDRYKDIYIYIYIPLIRFLRKYTPILTIPL